VKKQDHPFGLVSNEAGDLFQQMPRLPRVYLPSPGHKTLKISATTIPIDTSANR
jgi:hypothetical protein